MKSYDKIANISAFLGFIIGCIIAYYIQTSLNFFGATHITMGDIILLYSTSMLISTIVVFCVIAPIRDAIQKQKSRKEYQKQAEEKAKEHKEKKQRLLAMTDEEFEQYLREDAPDFSDYNLKEVFDVVINGLVSTQSKGQYIYTQSHDNENGDFIKNSYDFFDFKYHFRKKNIEFSAKFGTYNYSLTFRILDLK
jgi:large-conductance mechanosensitive channel